MRVVALICFLAVVGMLGSPVSAQTHVTAPNGRVVSEWWYQPSDPGWGLVLTHAGTQTVVLYTGFDANGQDLWQVGVGARSGQRIQADLLQSHWDAANGRVDQQFVAGAIDLRYLDADHAQLVLTQGGQSKTVQIERVISTRQSSVDDYSGLWHNPAQPGFGMALLTQGPVLAVVATAYDASGNPRWWLGYKLSKPNDPAPFTARRFQKRCQNGGCSVVEATAGSISIQPRSEREISAQLALADGFSATPDAIVFQDHALYANLGEPASGRERPSDARPFHSEAALEDYYRMTQAATPELPFECLDFSPLPPGATGGPGGSVTNTQETSTDEGDLLARSGDLVVHRVASTVFTSPPITLTEFRMTRIRDDRTQANTIRILPLPEWQYADSALALPATNGQHRFALLTSNHQNGFAICCPQPVSVTPKTTLTIVRVNADDSIAIEWQYTVEARPGVLRRNGNDLLLLTNSSLLQSPDPNSPATVVTRPRWRFGNETPQLLLKPANTWLGGFQPGTLGSTVMTVHRLPLSAPNQVQHFSMLMSQAQMYVGDGTIYLASQRQDPSSFGIDNRILSYKTMTNIHKLDATTLAWRGSADVRGTLAAGARTTWGLQEKSGDLRVFTAIRDLQSGDLPSTGMLTVLSENNQTKHLDVRASLPNANRPDPLGNPGTSAQNVRLFQDRLQFLAVPSSNPMFDVDLSNPDDPRIAGRLDLSSYSEYLYRLPDQKLLGFGIDAIGTGPTPLASEGLKLSLYSDRQVAEPISAQQHFYFGGAASEMPLRTDPHAISVAERGTDSIWFTTPVRLGIDETPGVTEPLSVLRLHFSRSSGRLLEAKNIPTDNPADDVIRTSDARTVIFGNQLYLFLDHGIFGESLDSQTGLLPRLNP